jgi:hypothetical protein
MKLSIAGLSLMMLCTSQAVLAEDVVQKNYGVTFKYLNSLFVRKQLSESALIYAGISLNFGQQSGSSTSPFDTSSSIDNYRSYAAIFGARKYFNNERVSKFINLEVIRGYNRSNSSFNSSFSGSSNTDDQSQYTSANITCGIEYFISSNVSIEGAAGIGMNWIDSTSSSGFYDSYKSISFPVTNIAMTYYW